MLCDQIIYSDPDRLGHAAQRKKAELAHDIEKRSLYKKLKDLIEKGKLDTAKPLWDDFQVSYEGYDPEILRIVFASISLSAEEVIELKERVVADFDDA